MDNLYLFYGESKELIRLETKKIIEKKETDEYNISYFDMEEVLVEEALNEAYAIPFLVPFRVVVLTNAYFFGGLKPKKEMEHNLDYLVTYLEHAPKSTILIIECPSAKLDTRKVIYKSLFEYGIIKEVKSLTKDDIDKFIRKMLKDSNHVINPDALALLTERIGEDNNNVKNEMDKLITYLDDNQVVTKEIVDLLIIRDPDDNIFDLVNALLNHQKDKTLACYYDLLKTGYNSTSVISVLITKFQEILYTKELIKEKATQEDIMRYFSATKGRAYFLMKNAKENNIDKVVSYLNELEEMDYLIKSGLGNENTLCELFLIRV